MNILAIFFLYHVNMHAMYFLNILFKCIIQFFLMYKLNWSRKHISYSCTYKSEWRNDTMGNINGKKKILFFRNIFSLYKTLWYYTGVNKLGYMGLTALILDLLSSDFFFPVTCRWLWVNTDGPLMRTCSLGSLTLGVGWWLWVRSQRRPSWFTARPRPSGW